ncbi:MAG: Universal stress protein family protein [Syntrophorhabdaceae bacterium PtaU1.Bin034]|jgi:nucleotide-binding universal stress UspA family protein|nr:MAG: Universal stress protein family protein [Syntrophorhabdaceae bacterium PtaU1.Bin034]
MHNVFFVAMRKILVAIDGSECAFRAVAYCGDQFSGLEDLSLTLFHVLPGLPPRFWDEGHLLDEQEKRAKEALMNQWIDSQKKQIAPMFGSAIDILKTKGIGPEQVETKAIYDSTDVAGTILEEARDGGYLTLVLGRAGFSQVGEFISGSIATKIINRGAGLAICVVE